MPGARFMDRSAVRLGIQKNREVVDDIPGDSNSVVFIASLRVVRLKEGGNDFRGPYVFGNRGDRFLYLCWGERKNGKWEGFRRAKIKLAYAPTEVWEQAINAGCTVVGQLELTDAKGGPKCASLKPGEVMWSVAFPG
jgi:hypothetical protein